MNFIKKDTEEADSSREAWKYYKSIYTKNHWPLIEEFDLENILTYEQRNNIEEKETKRYLAYIKENSSFKEKLGSEFSLGGECDFNFNKKKEEQFKTIIGSNFITTIKDKLEKCCLMHHNRLNISLMATTGGMNNFKGTVYFDNSGIKFEKKNWSKSAYDRLDTFVYCLNELFERDNEIVLSCSNSYNRDCLRQYLKTFCDICDYCKKIYFIDNRDFVNKLIENGCKPINNSDDLERYMDLAIEFWQIKKDNIDSNL